MESIQSFDLSLLNAIQDTFRCGFLDVFTVFLSYLTTSGIIWIVAGVVLLLFRKTRAAGIILLMALAIGYLNGDVLLKHLVNRPRPFTVNPDIVLLIKQLSGASFPSTHSTLAAASTTVLLVKKLELFYMCEADLTRAEMAKRLHYESPGTVSKRIKKIQKKLEAFLSSVE